MRRGSRYITDALRRGQIGEYQAQAAIAAVHDQARSAPETDWADIVRLYDVLERLTPNPVVTLNRAAAVAMVDGPLAALSLVDTVADRLGEHHRFHAVRAHLLEMAGDPSAAVEAYRQAAARAL